ncbi:YjaG family protein [Zymobacter sp. IVIA_5232.4 C2]|uniref:YjaG family protein n=1 Tax=Zymobacter sp. IVIA_5232.4 C2 TaxID=3394855 RepID=UPI0039C3453E
MNEQQRESRIHALSERDAQAFMAALAERMLINLHFYVALSELEQKQVKRADNALGLVWEALMTPQAQIDFLLQEEKLAALEERLAEDEDSFGARMAGDALMALSTLLESMATDRKGGAVEVSRLSAHGVAQLVMMQSDEALAESEWQQRIDAHPLMADECDFQDGILDALYEAGTSREALKMLRRMGQNDGVSNLGLSLNDD